MDKLVHIMKITLGTAFTLYVKVHGCHWNLEGPFFSQYHSFFETIYDDIWHSIDDIAEQIRQLDAYAPSTLEQFIELSRIENSNEVLPATDMVITIMKDTEVMIDILTEALHAAEAEDKQGLVNFLAGRIETHSKWRWQLRASAKRLGQ